VLLAMSLSEIRSAGQGGSVCVLVVPGCTDQLIDIAKIFGKIAMLFTPHRRQRIGVIVAEVVSAIL
jgi:hypothetical protein